MKIDYKIGKKWINTNETDCYFIKMNNFKWNEWKNGSLIGSYEEKECYYDYVSLVDISRDIFVKLTNRKAIWFKGNHDDNDKIYFACSGKWGLDSIEIDDQTKCQGS